MKVNSLEVLLAGLSVATVPTLVTTSNQRLQLRSTGNTHVG